MRVKEMHPLCCISAAESSPEEAAGSGSGSEAAVAGVLQKWTNYGKGWRSRWFMLRSGLLSYAKIRHRHDDSLAGLLSPSHQLRLIGDNLSAAPRRSRHHHHHKTVAIVHLKISSFRESKSDERRFYIFTATKTLHLRSGSKRDREAWVQALVSTRSLRTAVRESNDLFVSTERLRKRLIEEGVSETLVNDCEQIMISEFSNIQSQLNLLHQERSTLLDTLTQLEATNIDVEASGIADIGDYQLTKHEFSSIGRGKYSECSTTESCDDIEKQEEASDEDEASFYDSREDFMEGQRSEQMQSEKGVDVERRKKLPEPMEKEKGVSLWSMIKDNVGKDLTRVCLPVYFNEPISSLQKCCEDLDYSYLLDRAYQFGKAGDSLQRALNVAAFAVSAYASSEGRHCKPFNPLLGETYEADFPDKGIRFFSEKVSHHPTLIACHCEGRGWKFWADSNLRTKFWGRSIQLDPVGDLSVEFDDGEVFQWNKVTTTIYNLILGKVYCDHHGIMHIRGNRQYSCKLKFKEQSLLDRNPRQVTGFVEDASGKKHAAVFGKWDDSMYYANGDQKDCSSSMAEAALLWKRTKAPQNLTRYNLTSFAITLNELTSELQEKLPPTDSRLRPDQRHLENGEYEKANAEKQRLEKRQRMSRKLQENGWKPRWFAREGENGAFRYTGGYWEARDRGKWDDCPDIFGEFDVGLVDPVE